MDSMNSTTAGVGDPSAILSEDDSFVLAPTAPQAVEDVQLIAANLTASPSDSSTLLPTLTPAPVQSPKQQIRRGPAGPRKSRTITLYYEEAHFPQANLDWILAMYNKGLPLTKILEKLNPKQIASKKPAINLIDLYTLLFVWMRDGKIKQRREPTNEMSLELFARFYKAWREGNNREKCMAAAHPFVNKYWGKKLYLALSARYRHEQDHKRSLVFQEESRSKAYEFERSIFTLGEYRIVEGVPCFVLPIRKVPAHHAEVLKQLPRVGSIFSGNLAPELAATLEKAPLDDGGPVPELPLDENVPFVPRLDLKPQTVMEAPGPSTAATTDGQFDDMDLDDVLEVAKDVPAGSTKQEQEELDEHDPFK